VSEKLDREELPLTMFPAGHGWTGNGKGTFSDAGGEAIVNIDRSFKIETNGAEETSIATSPELDPIDLTDKHVVFHSEVSFSSRLKTVKLRLASGNIATDFAEVTIWETDEDPIALQSTFERQSFPTGAFAVTGTVNWAAVKHAQILVTDNKAGKMTLYVAGIYAVPTPGQAMITFAFDDSLESAYTLALPVLSRYRFPATEYVIVDTVGESSFLTLEQLYTLRDQHSWEIAGHAFTEAAHNEPSGLDSLEGEALEEEVDGLRGWLDEHGFRRATFAYPKGAAGGEVRRLIKRDYGAGRGTGPGPETLPSRDDYTLRGHSINGLVETASTVKAKIDAGVAEGAWMILTFHKLVAGSPAVGTEFKVSAFEEVVDHVRTLQEEGNNIEVLTMADAMGAIPGSAPAGGAGGGATFSEAKVFTIPDEIKVPVGDTDFIPPFFVSLASGQTAKVTKVIHRLNSGTSATFKLQKNGADLTGFTGIEAKAETQTKDPTDQAVADGDRLALVVTAVSGAPKNLSAAVVIEYTVGVSGRSRLPHENHAGWGDRHDPHLRRARHRCCRRPALDLGLHRDDRGHLLALRLDEAGGNDAGERRLDRRLLRPPQLGRQNDRIHAQLGRRQKTQLGCDRGDRRRRCEITGQRAERSRIQRKRLLEKRGRGGADDDDRRMPAALCRLQRQRLPRLAGQRLDRGRRPGRLAADLP